MVVEAYQRFQFFRQIIWFLRSSRDSYNIRYQILYIKKKKLQKKSVPKSQF